MAIYLFLLHGSKCNVNPKCRDKLSNRHHNICVFVDCQACYIPSAFCRMCWYSVQVEETFRNKQHLRQFGCYTVVRMGSIASIRLSSSWKIQRYSKYPNEELFERFDHGVCVQSPLLFVRRDKFFLGFRLLYSNFVKMHVCYYALYEVWCLPIFTTGLFEYTENVNNSDFRLGVFVSFSSSLYESVLSIYFFFRGVFS